MIATSRQRALLLVSSAMLILIFAANLARAESLGTWTPTTVYPGELAAMGCSTVFDSVYCVGGFDSSYNSYDNVYYASQSGGSIGAWSAGTPYPTAIDSESCVSANATIYCVGGEEEDGAVVLNNVYYSQVSSASPSSLTWSAAASFPSPTSATSCVVYSSYIYCVGGFGSNGNAVSATYYASLGSPGINAWTSTTPYPKQVDSESCVVSSGYIYCVAGEGGNGGNPINNVYYAQLTSSGIGKWSTGPTYPAALAAISCVAYSGYIYCVGGFGSNQLSSTDAYLAAISSTGVGTWAPTTLYPIAIDTTSCVVASSYLYCVGGVSGSSNALSTVNYAYAASLGSNATTTNTSSTAPEFPLAGALPATLGAVLAAAAVLGFRGRRDRG